MNGQDFVRLVKMAFSPFLGELGFSTENVAISGRFYRVSFLGDCHVISVSYEPGDDALFVMVFRSLDGCLSDVDDHSKTLRLSDLNSRYMPEVTDQDRIENEDIFKLIAVKDEEERGVLKAAKELRLVLPRYLRDSRSGKPGMFLPL